GLGVLATFIPMDGLHFYKIAAVEMGYRLPQAPTPKHAVLPWLANKSLPDRVTVDPRRVLDRIFFRHSDRVDVVGKAMIIAFPVQSLGHEISRPGGPQICDAVSQPVESGGRSHHPDSKGGGKDHPPRSLHCHGGSAFKEAHPSHPHSSEEYDGAEKWRENRCFQRLDNVAHRMRDHIQGLVIERRVNTDHDEIHKPQVSIPQHVVERAELGSEAVNTAFLDR